MPRGSSSSVHIYYPEHSREELIARLRERLPRLNKRLPLTLVVLFGSYARGNYTVASDVDLLIIYKGEPREEAYALVKEELALPRLEPHLYTEAEYERARATVAKMTEGGIILFGGGKEERDGRV